MFDHAILLNMSSDVSEVEAPAPDLEAEAIRELSSWLQLEAARGDLSNRDERISNAFKDQQNIDYLCSNSSSIPWQDFRTAILNGRTPPRSPTYNANAAIPIPTPTIHSTVLKSPFTNPELPPVKAATLSFSLFGAPPPPNPDIMRPPRPASAVS